MPYSDQTQPPPFPQDSSTDQNNASGPSVPPYSQPQCRYQPPPRSGWGASFFPAFLSAGCATILAPMLLIAGFLIMVFYLLSSGVEEATGDGSLVTLMQGTGTSSTLRTRVLRPGKSDAGTIAVIHIEGAIGGNGSPLQGDGSMAYVAEQIRLARENDAVKAVILQIDSPGGGLTASDHLHHEVELLKETGKPVLAWAGGMMASGGYYIAVAADEIMATPTATVGSIGVIMQHFQVSDLLGKLGVGVDPITSGSHKDIGSPFREMTPEERKILQNYIDISHKRFVDIVARGRGLSSETVARLADGNIMDATTARQKDLIDSIGYIQDAIEWAEEKVGEESMRVIGYRRQISISDILSDAGAGAAAGFVDAVAGRDNAPRAMAVYETGAGHQRP